MQQFQLNPLPVKFGEASNLVKIWLFATFIERRPNRTETFYAILWCVNILLQYIHLKATQVTVLICSNFSWIHCQWNLVRRQTWSKFDFLLTKTYQNGDILRYLLVHEYSSTVYTPKGHWGSGNNMQQFQLNPLPVKFGEASNLIKMWLFANEDLTERRHFTLSCGVWIFFYSIYT